MEIEILERKENPLLKREEIIFRVSHSDGSTPPRDVVVGKLAAMVNADKARTILKSLDSEYGLTTSHGRANVYETEELAMRIEPKHILKRNGLLEETQ